MYISKTSNIPPTNSITVYFGTDHAASLSIDLSQKPSKFPHLSSQFNIGAKQRQP